MTNYTDLPELRAYYLEDSWVLDVVASPGLLMIAMDLVLTPEHPDYRPPRPDEQYCLRRGHLSFTNVTYLEWAGQGVTQPARDATGEIDYGNIDAFSLDQGECSLVGDFGEIRVRAGEIRVELSPQVG
jgi:hypothetical protein